MKIKHLVTIVLQLLSIHCIYAQRREAPAPLYNDPIYDGAADPVLIWNHQERSWWMLYTARRANMPTVGTSAYHGTKIGIASSSDNGTLWTFRGYLDLEFEKGMNTFWAPDIIYHKGMYHLFVSYIPGVRNHFGGQSRIVYYKSKNLWDWKYVKDLTLSSNQIIDLSIYKKADGTFKIWFKDESKGSITMTAESKDLLNWETSPNPAIGGGAHEGPKVFQFQNYYWMLTDEWKGLRVYRSTDLENWEKQGLILDQPSARKDDWPSGAHADVVVIGEDAYVFYFTHPGRSAHGTTKPDPDNTQFYNNHRTAIQVAPLRVLNGTLEANRSKPFEVFLPNLEQKK